MNEAFLAHNEDMENWIEQKLKKKVPNEQALQDYGFIKQPSGCFWQGKLEKTPFELKIWYERNTGWKVQVIDPDFQEEYRLHLLSGVQGEFAAHVKAQLEKKLDEILEACCLPKSKGQLEEIHSYLKRTYDLEAEYLFKDDDETAVWRLKENQKWVAIMMKVAALKLGLPDLKDLWIVNVKIRPEKRQDLLAIDGFHEAYHMNKTHWISLRLDGSLSNVQLFSCLDESIALVLNPKRKNAKS